MSDQVAFEIYKNKFSDNFDVCDYKDWQVPLGRRFNALKFYWMIKYFGTNKLAEIFNKLN